MSGTRRLFLAVDLPLPLARRLAEATPTARGVRRVPQQSIHLTLHFLGDVAEATIPALVAALNRVQAAPFALQLAGRGRFPARGPARVLWVGLAPSPALESLQAACGRAIASAGLPLESRPFTPHITLARLTEAAGRRIADEFLAAAPIPAAFPVERIVLYASERTPAGPLHQPLLEVSLTG